jgi:hypothetical protein
MSCVLAKLPRAPTSPTKQFWWNFLLGYNPNLANIPSSLLGDVVNTKTLAKFFAWKNFWIKYNEIQMNEFLSSKGAFLGDYCYYFPSKEASFQMYNH